MPFFAALSTNADTRLALDEACAGAREALHGPADLALLFFSPHHAEVEPHIAGLRQRLGAGCLLGCSGAAIVGNGQEIEQRPALSLWLARWAQPVTMQPFHVVRDPGVSSEQFLGLPDGMVAADPRQSVVLLLGDPFTFPAAGFLQQINEKFPGLPVVGGMASGGRGPGLCKLVHDDTVRKRGAVGVLLSGPEAVCSVVSQGCRPIGKPFAVTRAQESVIFELDGKPPLNQMQQLLREAAPRDQQLMQQNLFIGRVLNDSPLPDFVLWDMQGLDRGSGALTVRDRVESGQVVQFFVRDADSAAADLHQRLHNALHASAARPSGALLFTCNRRGSRLFAQPNHDAGILQAEAGTIPTAGFFAEGEIGPVGGRNRVHGYTASVVLFGD